MNQSELKLNARGDQHQAREKAGGQVAVGFRFSSDWLRRWREIF